MSTSPQRGGASGVNAIAVAAPNLPDPRANHLDDSALSPQEFAQYSQLIQRMKPARSGAPGHVEEEDCLRFLRQEADINVDDEVRILSMFQRFPLGLLPGHFYALLRLAAWVQHGQQPSKATLFTQAPPLRTKTSMGSPQLDVAPAITSATRAPEVPPKPPGKGPPPPPPPGRTTTASLAIPAVSGAGSYPTATLSAVPPTLSTPLADDAAVKTPMTPAAANPFRTHTPNNPQTTMPPLAAGIRPFDPAPNPFKQSRPKLIRPTPVVADANHPVLVGAMMNPFKPVGTLKRPEEDQDSNRSSPVSQRSVIDHGTPSIPPRSGMFGDRPPPPLPPRQINPLIQAGLMARESVRKQQESLPPKTYTVLQSSSNPTPTRSTEPRLLDGSAPPPGVPLPPPTHHAKRRLGAPGYDPRRSVSESAPHPPLSRGNSGSNQGDEQGIPMASNAIAEAASRKSGHLRTVSGGVLASATAKGAVGPMPPAIAPKPSYGGLNKGKGGVPSWLKQQQELQRTGQSEDPTRPSVAPPSSHSRSSSGPQRHVSQISRASSKPSSRAEFLDDDDEQDDVLSSEQARSAASIDRNNPFFLRNARDAGKASAAASTEQLTTLAVARAAAAAARRASADTEADTLTPTVLSKGGQLGAGVRPISEGADSSDPLRRSKTLHSTRAVPPPAPPRRRLDVLPATLDSGTYAGFGRPSRPEGPNSGELRLTPVPQRADVGLPAHVLAEREKAERDKMNKLAASIVEAQAIVDAEAAAAVAAAADHSGSALVATTEEEEQEARDAMPAPLPPPPMRRPASVLSTSSGLYGGVHAGGVGIRSASFGEASSKSTSLTERAKELFGLGGSGAAAAAAHTNGVLQANRHLEQLKHDFASAAQRHEWLSRAAERAKGRPLNEATVALMESAAEEEEEGAAAAAAVAAAEAEAAANRHDAPDVDNGYDEESRAKMAAAVAAAARTASPKQFDHVDAQQPPPPQRRHSVRVGSIAASQMGGVRRSGSQRRSTAELEGPFADGKFPPLPERAAADRAASGVAVGSGGEDEVRPDTNGWQQL